MKANSPIAVWMTKNRYYLPGMAAVIVCIVVLTISAQLVLNIRNSNKEITEVEAQTQALRSQLAALEDLRQGGLNQSEKIANSALPPEKPVFETLRTINTLSQDTGVVVQDLQSRPGSVATGSAKATPRLSANQKQAENFEGMIVSLNINGPFDGIITFLYNLLEVAPLMELKSVDLSSRQTNDETQIAEFSSELEIEAYWKPAVDVQVNITPSTKIDILTTKQIQYLETVETFTSY